MHAKPLARADLITGVALVAFGLAVVAESYGMPRLSERNINPWTVPGLVPGLLGIVVALLGAILALRSLFGGALRPHEAPSEVERVEARASRRRLVLCGVLCFIYAVALVGRLPFWLASGLFVFAFIAAFEWRAADARKVRLRKLAGAAAIAVVAALAISYLFETLFFVRLP
jgi:putative tricarboxylic transport membrane protein